MVKYLSIAICFISLQSWGQLKAPVIGQEYSTDRKENFSGFIGETAIGLFTADYIYYNRRKQELIIRNFHKGDLQLVDSKNIYTQIQEGYTNDPQEIYFQNGKFYLFSRLDSERDRTKLLAVEVFNELLDREKVTIIDTLDSEEVSYIEEAESKDGFLVAKHFRIAQMVEQQIDLVSVDPKGDVSWKKTILSPMALQSLRIEKIKFNSNSPVYLLCNYAFNMGESSAIEPTLNNKYALWAYDRDQNFLKEFDIRIKNKWINGLEMDIHTDGDLLLSGYFNETKNMAINGVFSMVVNKDLSIKNTSWHQFSTGTLDKFIKEEDRKKKPELEDYELKEIVKLNDNSFYLIGEQYYKYIERSYDPRTNITTTTEYYNYNSIIVSYFDSLGNHKWTDRIPKAQSSTNDFGYFSSFASMNAGDELFLFFNDSQRNNESPPKDYFSYSNLFNNRKFQITFVQIKPKGIAQRAALVDDSDNFMLRAKLCGQLDNKAAYLITETNRSSKIIRVEKK